MEGEGGRGNRLSPRAGRWGWGTGGKGCHGVEEGRKGGGIDFKEAAQRQNRIFTQTLLANQAGPPPSRHQQKQQQQQKQEKKKN